MKQQVKPIVDELTTPTYGFDASTTQAATLLAALANGAAGVPEVLDWAHDHYIPNHHWFGTCQQGTSTAPGLAARHYFISGVGALGSPYRPVRSPSSKLNRIPGATKTL